MDNFRIEQDFKIYLNPFKVVKKNVEDYILEGRTFKCNICNKNFKKSCRLSIPFLSVHDEKRFKCEVCPSNFTLRGSLKRHVKSVHEGTIFKCEVCSSSFAQKDSLKKHIKSSYEGRTFKCDQVLQQNLT